jgi:hypothetical protein
VSTPFKGNDRANETKEPSTQWVMYIEWKQKEGRKNQWLFYKKQRRTENKG